MLDKQTIDELERKIDLDSISIKQLRREEAEEIKIFKDRLLSDIENLKRIFEKIGKQISCLKCNKISTESLMIECGHAICSNCSLKITKNLTEEDT